MTWDLKTVADIIEVQPRRYKFKTNEYREAGLIPIIDQGTDFIAGFTDALDKRYEGPLPIVIFGDHTCCLKYIDFPFAVGADGTQLLRPVDGVDVRYLYYALQTAGIAQFGYQRHFKLLKECKIAIPPLETQRRIAAILGAYDDLIEVNRRRLAVLEEMARGLFEDFARNVDEKALLFDVAAVSYGKNLPKSQLVETGPYPVYGASKIIGRYSSYTHQKRTILLGCRGTVGEFQISQPNSFITNNSFSIEPKEDVDFPWLFFALKKRGVADTVSGSAQPQITLQGASRVEILYPSADKRAHFHSAAFPMLELSWLLGDANEKLAVSRDLLLPRLISGQLSVEAAERELEAAA